MCVVGIGTWNGTSRWPLPQSTCSAPHQSASPTRMARSRSSRSPRCSSAARICSSSPPGRRCSTPARRRRCSRSRKRGRPRGTRPAAGAAADAGDRVRRGAHRPEDQRHRSERHRRARQAATHRQDHPDGHRGRHLRRPRWRRRCRARHRRRRTDRQRRRPAGRHRPGRRQAGLDRREREAGAGVERRAEEGGRRRPEGRGQQGRLHAASARRLRWHRRAVVCGHRRLVGHHVHRHRDVRLDEGDRHAGPGDHPDPGRPRRAGGLPRHGERAARRRRPSRRTARSNSPAVPTASLPTACSTPDRRYFACPSRRPTPASTSKRS